MRYKVEVADLQTGMYVTELDRPWVGTPFLFQGFLIEADEELEQLKSLCKFVVIDEAQSKNPVGPAGKPLDETPAQVQNNAPEPGKLPSQNTPPTAARTSVQASVGQLLAGAKDGKQIDIEGPQRIVARLVQQSTNQNLMMQMSNLRNKQDRQAGHSLNTAILAIAFGRHLGHAEDRLRLLGMGAILHDIGKTRVPRAILDKPGKLTDEEFAVVKRHPADGYEMLSASNNVPEEVLNMVRLHHERADGSGYPNGLKGDEIPLSVSIISIAESYETLTTDNSYQKAKTPVEALQQLRTTGPDVFGKDLTQDFIRFMGLYPVGSVVKLNSDDIAIVFSADPKTRMRPLIIVVRDGQGTEIRPHRLVNLAVLPESKLSIASIVDPRKYSIDIPMLFEKELGT